MITVGKALSYDVCSNFKLLSGRNGLSNAINIVGFFEWEQGEEIVNAFFKGVFVLTTLSMFKNDIKKAEGNMKLMINNGVSAIAIKDIFFRNISDELKEYSDRHNVPIFVFHDTYINEIIRVIQNAVNDDRKYSVDGARLEILIKDEISVEYRKRIMDQINPYLKLNDGYTFYFSDMQHQELASFELLSTYEDAIFHLETLMRHIPGYEEITYSIATYKRGFFLLFSDTTEGRASHFFKMLLKELPKEELLKRLAIGISGGNDRTEIQENLRNAIFANTRAILDLQSGGTGNGRNCIRKHSYNSGGK